MRSIGQEYLDPGSKLTGFQFQVVIPGSKYSTDMIKPGLYINDTQVDLEDCLLKVSRNGNFSVCLHISFKPVIVPSLSKVFIELSTHDPLGHTGLLFFCDPFNRGLKYRRYHNGSVVHGRLLFNPITTE
jgi:hypothetical protein